MHLILYLWCEDAVLGILCVALPTTIVIHGECTTANEQRTHRKNAT